MGVNCFNSPHPIVIKYNLPRKSRETQNLRRRHLANVAVRTIIL